MGDLSGPECLCHQGLQRGGTSQGTAGKAPTEHLLDMGIVQSASDALFHFILGASLQEFSLITQGCKADLTGVRPRPQHFFLREHPSHVTKQRPERFSNPVST